MAEALEQIKQDVKTILYDETQPIGKAFAKIEAASNRKREECFAAVTVLFVVYLIVGYFAKLLCNTVGFTYPAYMSIKAIESADKRDDTQWLTYWTIFALFSLIDFFADKVIGYFPFYWLLKCFFLLWLYLPIYRGAEKLYQSYVRPYAVARILPSDGAAQ
uniref:Receptor expression-enhancing protein n=1 Tax=Trichuris muris TaxID=70415 RepID=A0A5S6Q0M9_TRIMR